MMETGNGNLARASRAFSMFASAHREAIKANFLNSFQSSAAYIGLVNRLREPSVPFLIFLCA